MPLDVTVYPVILSGPLVAIPIALRPPGDEMCRAEAEYMGTRYYCTRRAMHSGRHAATWWTSAMLNAHPMANVRAVWGTKAVPVWRAA